jgi:CubicO group peptidase (beta-lactamase class C family)
MLNATLCRSDNDPMFPPLARLWRTQFANGIAARQAPADFSVSVPSLVAADHRCYRERSTNDVDFMDGMQWGLSFLINPQSMPTGRSAGSLAWAGLANSYYSMDPVKQVTGVYATQLLPFFDAKAVQLFQEFETAVYRLS